MESPQIRLVSWDQEDGVRLRQAQQLEIEAVRPKGPGTVTATAANVPVFLVAYQNDIAVGCGGLRPLGISNSMQAAEIKRMYVVPDQRGSSSASSDGKSVAQVVLEALEKESKNRGWTLLKAKTGKDMTQASRFYQKFGYVLCDKFDSKGSLEPGYCYEKHL